MTKYISLVTSILVLIIAIMSFVLSYPILKNLALIAGFPDKVSFLFPLIIYLTYIVYGLTRTSRL